jgi:carbon monoxide dehydrogenase subunit G
MRRHLLALCLLLPLASAWAAGLSSEEVTVDYRDGEYFANLAFRVAVAPAVALAVLTDFDRMAEFVPNLSSSRVLAKVGNIYRVAQEGKVDFGPFAFRFASERRIEVFPEGRIVARALSGSTKYMRSELRLQPAGDGVRIDYRIEMIPDDWIPSGLGINMLRHELAEQFSALGREMERRQGLASR